MKTAAKTPAAYIAALPPERRAAIKQLDALIRRTVPRLKPCIIYSGLGYGAYHYRYASGREGDSAVIGLSSRKNYISLYVMCTVEKEYLAERYREVFPHANIGRCCIRVRQVEDLPAGPLRKLLKEAACLGGMSAV